MNSCQVPVPLPPTGGVWSSTHEILGPHPLDEINTGCLAWYSLFVMLIHLEINTGCLAWYSLFVMLIHLDVAEVGCPLANKTAN